MSGGNNGPVPTRLVFLSDLQGIAVGEKVRFLGCVTSYTILTATLTLHHAYPPSPTLSPPKRPSAAYVNLHLLLSTLKTTDTAVGEWVNIIGYITAPRAPSPQKARLPLHKTIRNQHETDREIEQHPTVHIQALMLWSAGAINLGDYERHLSERQEVEKRLMTTTTTTSMATA
ncbi:MAG: hypothetical protein M1827_004253 [Pycnora praestabilis]|nr:MAG: hypothetical protein M1827_004253 [Pycnora praestabilis]